MVIQHHYLSLVKRKGNGKPDNDILLNTAVNLKLSNDEIKNIVTVYLIKDIMGNTGITLFQFMKLNKHERVFLLATLDEHFTNVEKEMSKKTKESDFE